MGIYQRSRGLASWRRRAVARLLILTSLLLSGFLGVARAQVPYVPTPMDVVERMLSMAKVGPTDFLIDLGSGDGRLVREAALRFGARGMGIERDPELIERSTELARRQGVTDKVAFVKQDLFEAEIGDASVLTMYLLPAVNMKLRPRLLATLKPGTRIVSHDFDLGDWQADETAEFYSELKYGESGGNSKVFLWIVPADVSGRWTWRLEVGGQPIDYELRVAQRFQKLDVVVRVAGQERKVEQVELRGDALKFSVLADIKGSPVRQRFEGRIGGDGIEGTVASKGPRMQGAAEWSAVRTERGFRSAADTDPRGVVPTDPSMNHAAVAAASTR